MLRKFVSPTTPMMLYLDFPATGLDSDTVRPSASSGLMNPMTLIAFSFIRTVLIGLPSSEVPGVQAVDASSRSAEKSLPAIMGIW